MKITDILQRYNHLRSIRDGYWLDTWREVRHYCYPNEEEGLTEGGKRGTEIFDTTAITSCQRLASGIYAWMLDPAKRMIEIIAADKELQKKSDVKQFYAALSKKLLEKIANSNYATIVQKMLKTCACGIDGVVYLESGMDGTVRFQHIPIESVCYQENSDGRVNTVFREMNMTAIQILEKFANDNIPDKIRQEAADPKRMDTKHKILHAVFPRGKSDKSMLDNKNFAFADYYIHIDTKTLIRESGFVEFPFFVCRFEVASGESYGRGPGIDLLPDIKMLNRMRQSYIIGSERANDPDTLIPENSLVDETWNREAGATHFYRMGANGEKPEYMYYPVNLAQIGNDIERERQNIKNGFYLDIFDPLGDIKNITATEAEIRNEGKLVPFSTLVGNIHSDFLAPMIHRLIGIMARNFELEDMPVEVMENSKYNIEFVSKIALAIKQSEASNYLRFEAAMQGMLARHPEVEDNIRIDDTFREIALSVGINPDMLTTEAERDKKRAEVAEQQNAQMQSEMLANEAKALGSMGGVEELEKLEEVI